LGLQLKNQRKNYPIWVDNSKNKVAIDIISFGEDNALENQAKLEALYKGANSADNCHLVTIPPGAHMLSEMLATSPIIRGANAGPDTGSFVDDNIDPEFAEAIRLSLAQEQPKAEVASEGSSAGSAASQGAPMGGFATDDPELAEAIRISLAEATNSGNSNPAPTSAVASTEVVGDMEEDDELARAIALSCETASADRANDEKAKEEKEKEKVEREKLCKSSDMQVELPNKTDESAQELDVSKVDPDFMSSLLLELPGIDPNDPDVQELLKGMKAEDEKKDTNTKK